MYLATKTWVTSTDMAFVSWLMDTRDSVMNWSEEICEMNGLDIQKYLEIKPSTEILGEICSEFVKNTGLKKTTLVVNGAGDLLTSALGSGAISQGDLHANVGTAGWIGTHHNKKTKDIPHYAGTIASGIPGIYMIICKQETLGGALEWAKNTLYTEDQLINKTNVEIYKEINELAEKSKVGAGNLIFTPWLFGERSPINDPHVRGQFFNIGLNNTRANL